MEKLFERKIENFKCETCGREVVGNGYTNHCPECLTSKHVDINPGDRASDCGGIMEPVGFECKKGEYRVKQRCVNCGFERMNKVQKEDNMDEVIKLAKSVASK